MVAVAVTEVVMITIAVAVIEVEVETTVITTTLEGNRDKTRNIRFIPLNKVVLVATRIAAMA